MVFARLQTDSFACSSLQATSRELTRAVVASVGVQSPETNNLDLPSAKSASSAFSLQATLANLQHTEIVQLQSSLDRPEVLLVKTPEDHAKKITFCMIC